MRKILATATATAVIAGAAVATTAAPANAGGLSFGFGWGHHGWGHHGWGHPWHRRHGFDVVVEVPITETYVETEDAHTRWCEETFRTYDPVTNLYFYKPGKQRECISPFS